MINIDICVYTLICMCIHIGVPNVFLMICMCIHMCQDSSDSYVTN